MKREEQICNKAKELGQTYFPDASNIWARGNIEAEYVEHACIEMARWLDAHPNWISVKDELPKAIDKTIEGKEFTATCFVCNRYNEYYAAYYVHCNDEWCGWYDEDGNEIVDVTHWMEIVPPEKGGAK